MKKKHNANLDDEQLSYATELIRLACNASNSPLLNLQRAIQIMEFGHIALEDMRDYLETQI